MLPNPKQQKAEKLITLFDLLKQASLSRTKARETLLQVLLEKHGPLSIEELHSSMKKQKVDLATVYRCLTAFEKKQLVRRCHFGDGIARYELNLHTTHHHHIICRICRHTENIDLCEVTRLEDLIQSKGYADITHHLEFFGICHNCQQSAIQNKKGTKP